MASIEMEQAGRDLNELHIILRGWYSRRDSDSVTIQNMRHHDMFEAERRMEELVHGVQPEHFLQLTIGREVVEATEFHHGSYDRMCRVEKKLAPGSHLPLRKADFHHDTEGRCAVRKLYVGWIARLTLAAVAKTLREEEGGKLAIVSFRPAETQALAA